MLVVLMNRDVRAEFMGVKSRRDVHAALGALSTVSVVIGMVSDTLIGWCFGGAARRGGSGLEKGNG
jgi:hypothetical protein